MLTRIAPMRAVAYWVRNHSAQLGAQMPTRSPLATPRAEQPAGHLLDRGVELGVGVAAPGCDVDERLAIGVSSTARAVGVDGLRR